MVTTYSWREVASKFAQRITPIGKCLIPISITQSQNVHMVGAHTREDSQMVSDCPSQVRPLHLSYAQAHIDHSHVLET